MSNTEENYLDNLLKAVSEPQEAVTTDGEQTETAQTDNPVHAEEMNTEEMPPIDEMPIEEMNSDEVHSEVDGGEEADIEPAQESEVVQEPQTMETESDENIFAELMKEDTPPQREEPQKASEDEFSIDDITGDLGIAMPAAEEEQPKEDTDIPDLLLDEPDIPEPQEDIPAADVQEAAAEPVPETELGLDELLADVEEETKSADEALTAEAVQEAPPTTDDDISDILELMDDDPDLSEINDMLKKVDNEEPVAVDDDDVMGLLNQMADDESKLDEKPQAQPEAEAAVETPQEAAQPETEEAAVEAEAPAAKKKAKKAKAKKPEKAEKKAEKAPAAAEGEEAAAPEKKPGFMSKLYHILTDEWEEEPTEEELAQKAAEDAAKKAEADAKKSEEQKAKEEAKKAKAEEKEAAKKAKAEAAAAKKKEKQEAKEAKLAEKRAKQEAEAPKNQKRLSPKKIATVTVFAASVLAGILLFVNYASVQSSVIKARRAYYEGDYKSVYVETYGEELDASDSMIEAKSKVILTLQRKLDSYENHLKLGQEVEALNALITGLQTYDKINEEAEACGVLSEVDSIKENIVSILSANYGLSEEAARELLTEDEQVSYTLALSRIVNKTGAGLVTKDM